MPRVQKRNSIRVFLLMSKLFTGLFTASIVCGLVLVGSAQAQDVKAIITIDAARPAMVRVEGSFSRSPKGRNLSFTLGYGSVEGLGKRISDVKLLSANGASVG